MTHSNLTTPSDPHEEAASLLAWYAADSLEPDDQALVEAHLSDCAACQAELKFERRLCAEIAASPIEVEQGWAQLRERIERQSAKPSWRARLHGGLFRPPSGSGARAGALPWLGWVVAAQFCLLLALGARLWLGAAPTVQYHTLGATPAPATGDLVVIFRPETTERVMRQTLQTTDARIVGGPNAADAYILQTPPSERASGLVKLRALPQIELAEPIDAGGPS